MKLLLDTHVLLWALAGDTRLSATHAEAIEAGELYLSAASIWEIAIKRSIGKLDVPETVADVALDAGCVPLPIVWAHAEEAGRLPKHHGDPFDRMLIAQARVEGLAILSADAAFRAYDVQVIG